MLGMLKSVLRNWANFLCSFLPLRKDRGWVFRKPANPDAHATPENTV